jgi:hypothetical protein
MGTKKKIVSAAEQSAIEALQEELDRARIEHVSTQKRLQLEIEVLQHRLDELDAELAQARARERELTARLARKGS